MNNPQPAIPTPPSPSIIQPQPEQPEKKTRAPGAGRKSNSGKVPTQEQIGLIRAYSKIRLSLDEIATLCDISKQTLCRWMKKYPIINGTIKKGRAESKAHAVRNAYLRAFPMDEQVYDEDGKPVRDSKGELLKKQAKGDSILAIFLLKTMFGFKEPDKRIEIKGNKGDTEIVFNLGGKNLTPQDVTEHTSKFYDKK